MVIVEVEKDLEEILPGFIERTLKILKDGHTLTITRKEIEVIAHRLSGTAGGYGLSELGTMAIALEADCKNSTVSDTKLVAALKLMFEYLTSVEIKYF